MATEKAVIGQAQRILVDATNNIWHKISLWTHASDVEMPNGDPLNQYLTDMNDSINERFDGKYNSYNIGTTGITKLDDIPEIGYSRVQTMEPITAGDYTLGANHFFYCYSGRDSASIEKMAVMIDTTDLTSIVMYIAHYSIEARWTLTKIATQKQIDDLQMQIDELNNAFNQLNLFVNQSVGDLNARYQIIQDQMDWLEAELAELQEQLNDLLNELRDFKAETRGRLDKIDAIFNKLYGINSLYITEDPVAGPWLSELFGGKWILIQHAYLYATGFSAKHNGTLGSFAGMPNDPVSYDIYPQSYFGEHMTVAQARELGWDRDYSKGFDGRDSFELGVTNLPKHSHSVGYDTGTADRFIGYTAKDPSQYYGDEIQAINISQYSVGTSPESESWTIIGTNRSRIKGSGTGTGSGCWWTADGTQNNDNWNNFKSEPIELDPKRFRVYVWFRVE